ncbi:hypothetical protein [Sphingomonas sp. S-NIH.Pt15_0812]|nr:hypothetical protein [Sphingomonas sp. S-NIH.Pt15_0812]
MRLSRDDLALLDNWIEAATDAPTRPEAIRRLIREAIAEGLPRTCGD